VATQGLEREMPAASAFVPFIRSARECERRRAVERGFDIFSLLLMIESSSFLSIETYGTLISMDTRRLVTRTISYNYGCELRSVVETSSIELFTGIIIVD